MEQVTYGYKIKQARKKAAMTQKELSEKSGVSLDSIKKYESTDRVPKMETLRKIAKALNISHLRLIPFRGEDSNGIIKKKKKFVESIRELAALSGVEPYQLIADGEPSDNVKLGDLREALSKVNGSNIPDLLSKESAAEWEENCNKTAELLNNSPMNTWTTDDWISYGLTNLNEEGKKKVLEYLTDICEIDRYMKDD